MHHQQQLIIPTMETAAETLVMMAVRARIAHKQIAVQYMHKNKTKRFYNGHVKRILKRYKSGMVARIKFADNTNHTVSLPYKELGKTWRLI